MFKKSLLVFVLGFILTSLVFIPYAESNPKKYQLIVFHSLNCSSCLRLKADFFPGIEKKYKDKIKIEYREISSLENYKMMLAYQITYKDTKKKLPLVFIADRLLSGEVEVKNYLELIIENTLARDAPEQRALFPSVDLIQKFKSFSPLAVIFAGLIDGINPCAFTVIVFFITFLAVQKYRKKEIIATGISFIIAVFLTYLLLGLGLFNFFYQLQLFPHLVRMIYYLAAFFCFLLAGLAIYDLFKFKKTRQIQDTVLKLPERIKYYIQHIIGVHYRKNQKEKSPKATLLSLIVSAVILGLVISILEAVCTGQIYLPTIVFVLKTSHFKLQAWLYLILYNLMFIAPLFIVFLFALLGTTSGQFSSFMHRRLILIKILMAGLFLVLGSILVFGL